MPDPIPLDAPRTRSVLLATTYSPYAVSGVAQLVIDLGTELIELDWDVLFCYGDQGKVVDLPPRVSRATQIAIPLTLPPGFRTPLFLLRAAARILAARGRFEVCHAVVPQPMTAIALTVAKILGRRTVVTVFAAYPPKPNPLAEWIQRVSERWVLRISDAVVYECDATRRHFRKPEGVVIFSGIDVDHFRPDASRREFARRRLGIPREAVVVAFVGRVTKSKGVQDLANACEKLPPRLRDRTWLLIVGPLEDDKETLFPTESALSERTLFIGPTGKDEVREFYQSADIFALPSYAEGVSSSLIEAMSCGLPAVVSRVGGNPEVVEDGASGYVHAAGDVLALRDRLAILIESDAAREAMGKRARDRISALFEIHGMARQYLNAYEGRRLTQP